MSDYRCGVKAYHHPALMEILSGMQPEVKLLTLIDYVCFEGDEPTPWIGKSIDLEDALRNSRIGFEAEKLMRFTNACGTYLAKLAKTHPNRVTKSVKRGYAHWTITTPKDDNGI